MSKLTLDETKAIKVLIAQVKALTNTIEVILNNPTGNEIGKYASFRSMAQTYNDMAEQVKNVLKVPALIYTFNMDAIKSPGDTVWSKQKAILEETLLSSKLLCAALEGSVDFVEDEYDNLADFFQTHLRNVIFSVPEKEKEVQNAIEGLLVCLTIIRKVFHAEWIHHLQGGRKSRSGGHGD